MKKLLFVFVLVIFFSCDHWNPPADQIISIDMLLTVHPNQQAQKIATFKIDETDDYQILVEIEYSGDLDNYQEWNETFYLIILDNHNNSIIPRYKNTDLYKVVIDSGEIGKIWRDCGVYRFIKDELYTIVAFHYKIISCEYPEFMRTDEFGRSESIHSNQLKITYYNK